MGTFVRIQSYSYDVDENTRSFHRMYGNGSSDMYSAMVEEIGYMIEPIQDAQLSGWEIGEVQQSQLERYSKILNEKATKEEIEGLHNELGGGVTLPGVSCFEVVDGDMKEAAERLLDYFERIIPDELQSNDHYVLIFEGELQDQEGHDGEDVAKWKRDIERVEIYDFFTRYGLEPAAGWK